MGPKRFLFVFWEGGGNVLPQLGLVRRLVSRGHEVRVLSEPSVEDEVLAPDWMLTGAAVDGETRQVPTALIVHNIDLVPGPGKPAPGLGFTPARTALGRTRDRLVIAFFLAFLQPGAAGAKRRSAGARARAADPCPGSAPPAGPHGLPALRSVRLPGATPGSGPALRGTNPRRAGLGRALALAVGRRRPSTPGGHQPEHDLHGSREGASAVYRRRRLDAGSGRGDGGSGHRPGSVPRLGQRLDRDLGTTRPSSL
jgi:hypothetical protein